MRLPLILILGGIVLSLGTVTSASPLLQESSLKQSTAGCRAANAGALDLSVDVGRHTGMPGSGLVSGFRAGDVLVIVRKARAGERGLRHSLSLAALGEREIATVFSLGEVVLSDPQSASEEQARFAIPQAGAGWALFSSSMAEGEGEYTVTVRCEPPPPSSPPPTS